MKRILLATLFASSIAAAGDGRLAVSYTEFTLPNGLTVILHEDHSVPALTVNTWYNVVAAREKPCRTGFAHLFEHLMFMGSKNVPLGKFDEWLEAAGGDNNASTGNDRTNYYENAPASALELPLFLDSDRMGFLVDAMSPQTVDAQRDVVKNERRQSYENRPYGLSALALDEQLYPPDHPYHWPVIGSMEDLSAASYEDVVEFFKTYYIPNNASLVIAGDIDPVKTRKLIEYWFSDVPAGAPVPPQAIPAARLNQEKRIVLEDRVQLPRLTMAWLTPAQFAPGDAELDLLASILASGKNSRLYRRLVYDMQIAQDVAAYQQSARLGSSFQIVVTARAGHDLTEIEKVVQQEIDRIKSEPPSTRETGRAVHQFESSFYARMETIGSKADMLNNYFVFTGNPDYFNEDFARYGAVDPVDIQTMARTFLRDDGRVVMSVVPNGKPELAATKEAHQ